MTSMNNQIGGERSSKSYPGALTEGTQHRRGKGEDRSTDRTQHGTASGTLTSPVRAGLKEAIGVSRFRTKVKRRKACGVGKSAASDDAQYLSDSPLSIGDGTGSKSVVLTW